MLVIRHDCCNSLVVGVEGGLEAEVSQELGFGGPHVFRVGWRFIPVADQVQHAVNYIQQLFGRGGAAKLRGRFGGGIGTNDNFAFKAARAVVEIDAGDTFGYDTTGHADKRDREERAADRIFGLLPADQTTEVRALWE